jgi:hypothetical protein
MVKLRLKIIAFLFLLSFALQASAYTVQFADKAKTLRLRWKTGTINLALAQSLNNPSPLVTTATKDGILKALEKSLQHWKDVADVDFKLTLTDKTTVSPAGVRGDGVNLITIADTPDNILFFEGEPETAAKTRIFFNGKGQITEGDIVLNPYQLFSDDGTTGTFDLESVLTHEIGHLLGLGHSDITGATMHGHHAQNGVYSLPVAAFRTLAEDDIAGARALYGFAEDENCCGAINGKFLFGKEKAVKDLQIWLEDAGSGRIITGASSDLNGGWNLEGLPAGKYSVYAQSQPDRSEVKTKKLFSAERLGEVSIEPGKTVQFEKAFTLKPRKLSLDYLGFNSQLSTLAIPVNEGRSYQIYIADRSLQDGNFRVSFNSSYFEITRESLRPATDFNGDLKAYSFEVKIAPETPPGEYSLRIQNREGNVFYLVGALTVEPDVANAWGSNFLPEVNQ